MCVIGAHRGQKRASDPVELDLGMVVSSCIRKSSGIQQAVINAGTAVNTVSLVMSMLLSNTNQLHSPKIHK